ncbi:uncharacterized protein AB675_10791 [Cyphellophora attinorum]|uniref:Uncharacterized protein n=1 Tax=Cyphellophora attinorum TaxID=1664694 RepID=A0A0N1HRF9_9EURO|nr:uncharacterized protein AB675_10791 [Phialophora attinorum]KPI40843.1 hypothetical protein AB675_10791 [Phialophora attinorum]
MCFALLLDRFTVPFTGTLPRPAIHRMTILEERQLAIEATASRDSLLACVQQLPFDIRQVIWHNLPFNVRHVVCKLYFVTMLEKILSRSLSEEEAAEVDEKLQQWSWQERKWGRKWNFSKRGLMGRIEELCCGVCDFDIFADPMVDVLVKWLEQQREPTARLDTVEDAAEFVIEACEYEYGPKLDSTDFRILEHGLNSRKAAGGFNCPMDVWNLVVPIHARYNKYGFNETKHGGLWWRCYARLYDVDHDYIDF